MTTSSWRNCAHKVIAEVIAEVGTGDKKALRKALKDAYPFGLRKYHPYKIWCDEIQKQVPGLYATRKAIPPSPAIRPIPEPGPRLPLGDL
jgi:hypothetical protein